MTVNNLKIAAGIVTFNPNIERLKEGIKSLIDQVETIYVFDNGSKNCRNIEALTNGFTKIKFIQSLTNKGIAYALNRIYEKAKKDSYNWILTLDHDSIVPCNFVEVLVKYINKFGSIGVICPFVFDKRRTAPLMTAHGEYELTNFCMTSGSLVNLEIWELVGKYDEWLFIDLVDDDFCANLIMHGYKILRVNSVKLDHELGNLKKTSYAKFVNKLADLSKIEFFRKLEYKREVSPIRLYYSIRNIIYLNHKYRDVDAGVFYKRNCLKEGLAGIIRGNNKFKLIYSVLKGVKDGMEITKRFKLY